MKRIYIWVFFCIILFLFGCNLQQEEMNATNLYSINNKTENSYLTTKDNSIEIESNLLSEEVCIEYITIYVLPDSIPISIDKAHYNLYSIYNNLFDYNENTYFLCESVQIVDGNIFYLFRGYNDTEIHRTTFGWYFVDVYTGDVYDAGPGINELIPIE